MWLLLLKGDMAHNPILWLPAILEDYLLFTMLREANKCIIRGGGTVQSRLRTYLAIFYDSLQHFYSLLQVELVTNVHFSSISAVVSCPNILYLLLDIHC